MKRLLLIPFLLMACTSGAQESSSDASIHPETLLGVWQVDSSAFIDNGVIGNYTHPIAPIQWHFMNNGDYLLVTNGRPNSGSFQLKDHSIVVNLFGMESEYTILEMDEQHLELRSVVCTTESKTLETHSYLSR